MVRKDLHKLKIDIMNIKLEKIITPVFEDNRGCFAPIELSKNWIQSNISINDNPYTFRGMHLQIGKYSQTKKVSVIRGSIIDFVVDLRPETFGNTYEFLLESGQTLLVPNNFAHGFLTLDPSTIINYLVDNVYHKDSEISIRWDSVSSVKESINKYLNNDSSKLVISEKDKIGLTLEEFKIQFV